MRSVGLKGTLGETDDAGLLVLDEPTASLPEDEVRLLFDAMRRVKEAGSSVLYVTHRLEEVLTVCDVVTVLRDGRRLATEPIERLDEPTLIALILGRDLEALYPDADHHPADPLLEVAGLTGTSVRDVSFALRRREVLGLTGLVGAGYDEVPYLVYGASPPTAGETVLQGRPLGDVNPSPAGSGRAHASSSSTSRRRGSTSRLGGRSSSSCSRPWRPEPQSSTRLPSTRISRTL